MEINFARNIKLQYENSPERTVLVTVQDERLISHIDDHEIDDGLQHHRLTITITVES
jgi:hypothetical protein